MMINLLLYANVTRYYSRRRMRLPPEWRTKQISVDCLYSLSNASCLNSGALISILKNRVASRCFLTHTSVYTARAGIHTHTHTH